MNKKQEIKVTYTDVRKYYYKKSRVAGWQTIVIFLLRFVTLGIYIREPLLIKQLIDAIGINDMSAVSTILFLIAGAELVAWTARRLIERRIIPAQLRPMREIAKDAFSYIHRHSSSFFADHMSGSLLKQTKDGVDVYEELFDIALFQLITPIGLSIGAVVVLWQENIYIGAVLLLWIVIYLLYQFVMYRRKGVYEELDTKARSTWSGYVADTFSNHNTIEHSGSLAIEQKTHEKHVNHVYTTSEKNRRYGNIIYAVTGALMGALWVGGLRGGVWLRQHGHIELSVLLMTILYMQSLFTQLRGIGNVFKQVVKHMEDGKEYLRLMMRPHDLSDTPDAISYIISNANIVFDDVSFGYTDVLEIEKFSLTIGSGEHVGLVGSSGAGKSTLTKLLLRLYDVNDGSIYIDGKNISSYVLDSLRSQISYVPQEPILFHRSLRDNIMYGKPDATEQEMISATKRARAHNFIMEMKDGYESMVGERGIKLSGGQRQRVAIARAILHDAPIIVLDEATSSLDSVTESEIQEAMQEVMKGKTAIVIAHRLGTVKHLDRLLVLEGGEIVQEGVHTDLIEQDGIYRDLWEKQV